MTGIIVANSSTSTAKPPLERHHEQETCLFIKRLEKGRFVWPSPADGVAHLSAAQLAMLLEGIDWRAPRRTWRPELAG